MQRWTSKPLPVGIEIARVSRLDLEFEEVERDHGPYAALLFLNDPQVPDDTGRDHKSFAAAFSIFGHEHCWGEEDHCDWTRGPVSPFDRRPEHHLAPVDITVDVTDAIRQLPKLDELVVTVFAFSASNPQATQGILVFQALTAVVYQ
jgi:hypothetical protein